MQGAPGRIKVLGLFGGGEAVELLHPCGSLPNSVIYDEIRDRSGS